MTFVKKRIVTAILMVLVLMGQTGAVTLHSGQMTHNPAVELMTAEAMATLTSSEIDMNHDVECCWSEADTQPAADINGDPDECCSNQTTCNCPPGDCASAVLLPAPGQDWSVALLQKDGHSYNFVLARPATSLYRPPISL